MRLRFGWRVAVLHRLLVNLKSGQAIAGLVREKRGGVLVLVDAELFEQGARSPVRCDGEVIIDLDNVAYAQRLPTSRSTVPSSTETE